MLMSGTNLVVPILPITRQRLSFLKQFPSRVAHRDRSLKFLQIGFEKLVRDDQRLDGLASIAAAASSWSASDCGLGAEDMWKTHWTLEDVLFFTRQFDNARRGAIVVDATCATPH
jgi:hypothetical protein